MDVDKTKPHVVENDSGKTHYLGDVGMSLTQPKAPKQDEEKNERPHDNV
jgi:hypothetical protein